MQPWHDFFIAEVGASAALAGLLFVALSINIERILRDPALPARAAQSLGAFMLVVVLGSLALIPEQNLRGYGLESLAAVLAALAIGVRMSDVQLREINEYRPHMIVNVATNGLLHAFALGGALACIGSLDAGVGILAGVAIFALCYGMFNAWILLVEILR